MADPRIASLTEPSGYHGIIVTWEETPEAAGLVPGGAQNASIAIFRNVGTQSTANRVWWQCRGHFLNYLVAYSENDGYLELASNDDVDEIFDNLNGDGDETWTNPIAVIGSFDIPSNARDSWVDEDGYASGNFNYNETGAVEYTGPNAPTSVTTVKGHEQITVRWTPAAKLIDELDQLGELRNRTAMTAGTGAEVQAIVTAHSGFDPTLTATGDALILYRPADSDADISALGSAEGDVTLNETGMTVADISEIKVDYETATVIRLHITAPGVIQTVFGSDRADKSIHLTNLDGDFVELKPYLPAELTYQIDGNDFWTFRSAADGADGNDYSLTLAAVTTGDAGTLSTAISGMDATITFNGVATADTVTVEEFLAAILSMTQAQADTAELILPVAADEHADHGADDDDTLSTSAVDFAGGVDVGGTTTTDLIRYDIDETTQQAVFDFLDGIEAGDQVGINVSDPASVTAGGDDDWSDAVQVVGDDQYTITGLTNNEIQLIEVASRDCSGISDWVPMLSFSETPDAPDAVVTDLVVRSEGAIVQWLPPPQPVDTYEVEWRTSALDSQGNAMGFDTILEGSEAIEYEVDGLTDGMPAQFRVRAVNPGGETVGNLVRTEAVGYSKDLLRLPTKRALAETPDPDRNWYDDDPGGEGQLWVCVRRLISTRTGRKFYIHDRPMGVTEPGIDLESIPEWVTGIDYAVGFEVRDVRTLTIGTSAVQTVDTWRCLVAHTADDDDKAPGGSLGYWLQTGFGITADETVTPPASNAETDDDGDIDDGYYAVEMNRMIAAHGETQVNAPDRGGEYKNNETFPAVVSHSAWEDVKFKADTIALSFRDKNKTESEPFGKSHKAFYDSLVKTSLPGKVVQWYSAGRWIRWGIVQAYPSQNGRRVTLRVDYEAHKQTATGATDDIPTSIPNLAPNGALISYTPPDNDLDCEFRFTFTGPTETAPVVT